MKRITGSSEVPVLETDDGQLIQGSKEISDWAEKNAL